MQTELLGSNTPGKELTPAWNRRQFISGALVAAAASSGRGLAAESPAPAVPAKPAEYARKIKLGLVGCGGRGNWITNFFKKHGGYEFTGVADYFDGPVNRTGDALGVDKARRFTGLSGCKKLIDSGIEALVIEDVPYFYPEQAKMAVEAGVHVYMAKPVAVDVPGSLSVEATGRLATEKKRCVLVDYQLPTDPAFIAVRDRIRDGALGMVSHIASFGMGWHAWPDPPLGKNIESRLQGEIWLSDTALSGDTIVSYDIHIIDGIMSLIGKRPVSACGQSRICRPKPNGDRTDTAAVIYGYEDGTVWTHITQALDNNFDLTTLSASVLGMSATAHVAYGGKVYVRGGEKHYSGSIGSVYNEGVERNVAEFYTNITEGHFENLSVKRAVDGHLTAILGREAAARRRYLTMEELIKENKKLEVDLTGMKA